MFSKQSEWAKSNLFTPKTAFSTDVAAPEEAIAIDCAFFKRINKKCSTSINGDFILTMKSMKRDCEATVSPH